MMRRLNYTGRRRIPRALVSVRLVPSQNGVWSFNAEFELAEFDFPAEARVYVEAYNATSYMRFEFGTVGVRSVPADLRLTEITPSPLPKFRLKVVDGRLGLLLAVADKLVPLRPEEDETHKQSLLPVDFRDLGDRIWRLDLTDWPVLELNRRIADLGEVARSADSFLALVYPEVVRRILHEALVAQDQTDPDFDDSDWTSLWLRYACSLPGIEPPPEGVGEDADARKEQWIEQTVQAFCRTRDARVRFEHALGRGTI
ncbi:MAG: hypothetical protein HC814_00010 [Rhodobacteraceae bacterium]|nr:hypothetical protein [Paracoccaceae bacterium]